MKKVYLACPYCQQTGDPEWLPKARFAEANRAAARLMQEGHIVFSPLSHSVPINDHVHNDTHEFWLNQDFPFIEWADEVFVLRISGWATSKGVRAEIKYAQNLGKPIKYIKP